MTDPTFRLEGVVRTREDMEDFEGPLTLILQLLAKNKIELRDVRISLLLDQYLEYLDSMKEMDLEIASEFVAMASHLVYIKTKMLLASGDEEVSEMEQLINSLEQLKNRSSYARVCAVTDTLADMFRRGAGMITKPRETLPADRQYRYSHGKAELLRALTDVFGRDEGRSAPAPRRPFSIPARIVYPVTEKTREIMELLRGVGVMRVRDLFAKSRSRTELVATFVVVLELCKDGAIRLSGADDDPIITAAAQDTGGGIQESDENGSP